MIKPMRTSDSDQVGALFPSSIAKKDQFHSPNDHTLSLVTSDLHEVPHRLGIPSSQWEFGLCRLFFTENKTDLFFSRESSKKKHNCCDTNSTVNASVGHFLSFFLYRRRLSTRSNERTHCASQSSFLPSFLPPSERASEGSPLPIGRADGRRSNGLAEDRGPFEGRSATDSRKTSEGREEMASGKAPRRELMLFLHILHDWDTTFDLYITN